MFLACLESTEKRRLNINYITQGINGIKTLHPESFSRVLQIKIKIQINVVKFR